MTSLSVTICQPGNLIIPESPIPQAVAMAEAFGVASSVVGIVSLGIQLTQGLLKYYGSWKDQDNVVADMCTSLDNLSGSLTVLEKALQPPARFDKSVKDSVEKNINAMYGTMRKLEDELRKVRDAESPKVGVRSAMRRHVRRGLYPFREETLNKIQRVVAEARQNLDLALQVLQMFVCPGYHKGEANWNSQPQCLGSSSRCSQACSLARRYRLSPH